MAEPTDFVSDLTMRTDVDPQLEGQISRGILSWHSGQAIAHRVQVKRMINVNKFQALRYISEFVAKGKPSWKKARCGELADLMEAHYNGVQPRSQDVACGQASRSDVIEALYCISMRGTFFTF